MQLDRKASSESSDECSSSDKSCSSSDELCDPKEAPETVEFMDGVKLRMGDS